MDLYTLMRIDLSLSNQERYFGVVVNSSMKMLIEGAAKVKKANSILGLRKWI